jgi:hypothetical protein
MGYKPLSYPKSFNPELNVSLYQGAIALTVEAWWRRLLTSPIMCWSYPIRLGLRWYILKRIPPHPPPASSPFPMSPSSQVIHSSLSLPPSVLPTEGEVEVVDFRHSGTKEVGVIDL